MTLRRKSQSRRLNMWHQKRSFVGSQAPPCKGILLLSVHPAPQDHVPKCWEPPDISSSFFYFFLSNSWWTAKRVSIFREREREALAVGEKTVPCGENPSCSDIKKKKKRNHWNGKWHQEDMHWISFPQECISFLLELRQLMSRRLKNKDSATCNTRTYL